MADNYYFWNCGEFEASWLNGITDDGEVSVADAINGDYTGTKWTLIKKGENTFYLHCEGVESGHNWMAVSQDGQTATLVGTQGEATPFLLSEVAAANVPPGIQDSAYYIRPSSDTTKYLTTDQFRDLRFVPYPLNYGAMWVLYVVAPSTLPNNTIERVVVANMGDEVGRQFLAGGSLERVVLAASLNSVGEGTRWKVTFNGAGPCIFYCPASAMYLGTAGSKTRMIEQQSPWPPLRSTGLTWNLKTETSDPPEWLNGHTDDHDYAVDLVKGTTESGTDWLFLFPTKTPSA